MASVSITVDTDDGSTTVIEHRSPRPLVGGVEVVMLVQQAYLRAMSALGVAMPAPDVPDTEPTSATPDPEPPAPAGTSSTKESR